MELHKTFSLSSPIRCANIVILSLKNRCLLLKSLIWSCRSFFLSLIFFSNHRLKYFLVDYIFANPSSPHDTTCLFFSSKVRLGLKNYDTLQKCYKITRWFCLCFVKSRLRKHCQGNDLCFGCYVFSSILPRF